MAEARGFGDIDRHGSRINGHSIIGTGGFERNVAIQDVIQDHLGIAQQGIAVTAATRQLHAEAVAGLQRDGLERAQRAFLAALGEKSLGGGRRLAADDTPATKFELVAQADGQRGPTERLILLAHAGAAAELARAGAIGSPFEAANAHWELGFDDLGRRVGSVIEDAYGALQAVVVRRTAHRAGEQLVLDGPARAAVLLVSHRDRPQPKAVRADRAGGIEMRQGLAHRVGQDGHDAEIAVHRGGPARMGDLALRVHEVDRPPGAIVHRDRRIERGQHGHQAAGFRYCRAEIDRPLRLLARVAEIDRQLVAAFGDSDVQTHRLVAVDAVVVDPALGLGFAIRPLTQTISDPLVGKAQELGHGLLDGFRIVFAAELDDALGANTRAADLGADVARNCLRHARVALHDGLDFSNDAITRPVAHRRHEQAFVIDLPSAGAG